MKPCIPILIVLLLVSTSFVGISNQAEEPEADIEQEVLLDHLTFYCTGANGLDTAKYEYYKEKLLEATFVDDVNEVEVEPQPMVSNPIFALGSPPMDSAWPMKCHDTHHTGRSSYGTANNSYYELWRYEFSYKVDSDPAIGGDGTIYVGGSEGNLPWCLFAINPDGSFRWSYKTDGLIWLMCPAITEDGTIYFGSWDNYLHAVNPNGTIKWKFDADCDIVSDPVIGEDGTIYFGTMWCLGKGGMIFAVNPDGSEKWYYKTGGHIVSDPAIGNDGTIYIGSDDKYLYAMNPNGTVKWRFKTGDWVGAPPSIANDGTIYFSSYDNYLYALYPNGTLKWKTGTGSGSDTNPSIGSDGTIYFCSYKQLFAINPDGSVKWKFNLSGKVGRASPAICADGIIYTGIEIGDRKGGEIVAVNPDGTEHWRKRLSNHWIDSSPCIGKDGIVYIVSTNSDYSVLHAFGAGGKVLANANGPYYGLINEPLQFTGSAQGGYSPYTWHWDFGDGNTSDEQNPSHIYHNIGNYTVTLTVTDNTSNQSIDTTWAWIQETNDPPDKPSIDGETNGKIKTEYDYTFLSSDPDDNDVWYHIGWGDKEIIYIYGPYQSGEPITLSYTWTEKGSYTITCWATDVYDEASEVATLEVTMPKSYNPIWWLNNLLDRFPLLQRLLDVLGLI